jgi:glycosyltransferase involved in cell wall biosynthesis
MRAVSGPVRSPAVNPALESAGSAALSAVPLTLLVIAYNEAANIGECLDSVPFAHEKIVIDSGSQDDTAAVARAHGARVVMQPWLGFGRQRNFANAQAANDWILFLDADERLSEALARELPRRLSELARDPSAVGLLPRATWFMGAPMRWYRPMHREFKARLYHRGHARWSEPRVHESLQYRGRGIKLEGELNHHHDPTLVHAQLKSLRYAELKALDWLDRGRPARAWTWPAVFVGTFLKDYLLRLAVLDGARGWTAAFLDAQYAVYKRLRYFDMRAVPESVRLGGAALAGQRDADSR